MYILMQIAGSKLYQIVNLFYVQGVKSGTGMTLTDPAIHSSDILGFNGFTDFGEAGIKSFFKSHICGNFCIQMGLNNHLMY